MQSYCYPGEYNKRIPHSPSNVIQASYIRNAESTNTINGHFLNRKSRQAIVFPDDDTESNSFRSSNRFNQRGNWRRRPFQNNDVSNNIPLQRQPNNGFAWNQPTGNFVDSPNGREDFSLQNPGETNFIQNWQNRRTTTQRTPTSTVAIPGMGTPRTPCENACQTTPEYNPVCGTDRVTYYSEGRLKCAQRCGKRK